MSINKREFGREGEEAVAEYLRKDGYEILEQNYQLSFGEIDIIAKKDAYYCFIEVKTRASIEFGTGSEAVVLKKQRTIAKVASLYLAKNDLDDVDVRFDVASVSTKPTLEIDMIENAFEATF